MNIIITGASNGIGKELVMKFAEIENVHIFAVARSKTRLEKLERTCKKAKAQITYVCFDVNHIFGIGLPASILKLDSVDILINNAGMLINSPFAKTKNTQANKMFQTNVFAPAEWIRLLLPKLIQPARSHVVNIGSMGGFQGSAKFAGLSFYSASKAALATLTECLAEEYKDSPIRFNTLALGAVQTEMLQKAFPGYEAPISAKDMAAFIADFALNGSKWFNGKTLPVAITTP